MNSGVAKRILQELEDKTNIDYCGLFEAEILGIIIDAYFDYWGAEIKKEKE